jgi:predicted GIY-YIG superfamily endonuclease
MSRRAPQPDVYTEVGDVYLLHLDPPYAHARHYTGFTTDLPQRLADHRAGRRAASRLMQVQHDVGGGFRLGRLWPAVTRAREVQVKESSAAKYCLICRGQPEVDPDLPPEGGARWVANAVPQPRHPDITPELIQLADQLIARWTVPKVPDLEAEAG